MAKYVVDGPEPKSGEKLSSGGIRKNGKMVKQYENAVPLNEYNESVASVTKQRGELAVRTHQTRQVAVHRNEHPVRDAAVNYAKEAAVNAGMRFLDRAVDTSLDYFFTWACNKLDDVIYGSSSHQDPACKSTNVIDVEAEEVEEMPSSTGKETTTDNVIKFPRKVG